MATGKLHRVAPSTGAGLRRRYFCDRDGASEHWPTGFAPEITQRDVLLGVDAAPTETWTLFAWTTTSGTGICVSASMLPTYTLPTQSLGKELPVALKKAGHNWVSGEQFFDREVEIEDLFERVRDGTHTLITAPRRMGKTSLVREFLDRLEATGTVQSIFVDLEGAKNAPEAIAEIAACSKSVVGMWRYRGSAFAAWISNVAGRLKGIRVPKLGLEVQTVIDSITWRRRGDRLFARLATPRKNKGPVVLALDELPIFLGRLLEESEGDISKEGIAAADAFLSWLRRNAQRHKDRVSLIVLGSVSLEPILVRAGLTAHANILSPLELKPWDEETAVACLRELAKTYKLDIPLPVRQEMCQLLGDLIPHHVQRFFDLLLGDLRRRRVRAATTSDVNRVYTTDMLGKRGQLDLPHWESRLRVALGPLDYRLATLMLTEAAVQGGVLLRRTIQQYVTYSKSLRTEKSERGATNSSAVQHVLDVLEHDGYLERDGVDYRFRSALLRDWWRDQHSLDFVPIAERVGEPNTE